jgi:hypothetical protein
MEPVHKSVEASARVTARFCGLATKVGSVALLDKEKHQQRDEKQRTHDHEVLEKASFRTRDVVNVGMRVVNR